MSVIKTTTGFLGSRVVKNPPVKVGDMDFIPGWGRSPGEGNGNPLQDSCLGNPMDRKAWRVTASRVAKSPTRLKRLNNSNKDCSLNKVRSLSGTL